MIREHRETVWKGFSGQSLGFDWPLTAIDSVADVIQ